MHNLCETRNDDYAKHDHEKLDEEDEFFTKQEEHGSRREKKKVLPA